MTIINILLKILLFCGYAIAFVFILTTIIAIGILTIGYLLINNLIYYIYSKMPEGKMLNLIKIDPITFFNTIQHNQILNFNKYYRIEQPYYIKIRDYFEEEDVLITPPKYSIIGYCLKQISHNFDQRIIHKKNYKIYSDIILHIYKTYPIKNDLKMSTEDNSEIIENIIKYGTPQLYNQISKHHNQKESDKIIYNMLFKSKNIKFIFLVFQKYTPQQILNVIDINMEKNKSIYNGKYKERRTDILNKYILILKLLYKKNLNEQASKQIEWIFQYIPEQDSNLIEQKIIHKSIKKPSINKKIIKL